MKILPTILLGPICLYLSGCIAVPLVVGVAGVGSSVSKNFGFSKPKMSYVIGTDEGNQVILMKYETFSNNSKVGTVVATGLAMAGNDAGCKTLERSLIRSNGNIKYLWKDETRLTYQCKQEIENTQDRTIFESFESMEASSIPPVIYIDETLEHYPDVVSFIQENSLLTKSEI